jgi:hypothetical protein
MIAVNPVTAEKLLFTDALNPVVNVVLPTCNTDPAGIVPLGIVREPVNLDAETSTI